MEPWSLWMICILYLVVIFPRSSQERRKRLKPRVCLQLDEFLKVVDAYKDKKIIRTGKLFLQGYMCVIEGDDYYYYTVSKTPVELPSGREVVDSRLVQF